MDKLIINWMYPDVLHLHGDRGNLMALARVGGFLGLAIEIRRQETPEQPADLAEGDMLVFTAGELRCMPRLVQALEKQRPELEAFVAAGKPILAVANSGAILAQQTQFLDGGSFPGLGLLRMTCRERERVYGDDLAFNLPDGLEILGSQIQVMDTQLLEGQEPLGVLSYGRGNNSGQVQLGGGPEGARSGQVIFTNTLGPLLVKNPRFAARLLQAAAQAKGLDISAELRPELVELEDKSALLIKEFIRRKQ